MFLMAYVRLCKNKLNSKSFYNVLFNSIQIRRMQDVLIQMQEKLKTNNERSNHNLYLAAQKSLENENKKMENVINV